MMETHTQFSICPLVIHLFSACRPFSHLLLLFLQSLYRAGLSGSRQSAWCGYGSRVWLSWDSPSDCCCGSQMKEVTQSLTGPFKNALPLSFTHTCKRMRALQRKQSREETQQWTVIQAKNSHSLCVLILHSASSIPKRAFIRHQAKASVSCLWKCQQPEHLTLFFN